MKVMVNGQECELEASGAEIRHDGDRVQVLTSSGLKSALAIRRGDTTFVSFGGEVYEVKKGSVGRSGSGGLGSGECRAPMPGQIVEVSVILNHMVKTGDRLVVLEAMKMQQPLAATIDGKVSEIRIKVGDQVGDGDTLVVITPTEE